MSGALGPWLEPVASPCVVYLSCCFSPTHAGDSGTRWPPAPLQNSRALEKRGQERLEAPPHPPVPDASAGALTVLCGRRWSLEPVVLTMLLRGDVSGGGGG